MTLTWIKLNLRFLLKNSWTITSIAYSILGLIAIWCSLEGLFPEECPTGKKVLISVLILLITYLASFIISIIYTRSLNSICVMEKGNGSKVYVRYGNYTKEFEQNEKRRNFIIPVNRCFDTIVDDILISRNSIHGQFLENLYSKNYFSANSLSSAIEKTLSKLEKTDLNQDEKPYGNRYRYPVGTIVDICCTQNNHYYLLGLSLFNESLTAQTSKEDFVIAIQRMIEYCNKHSQGYPVILPLIGSGLSRTNINKNEVLRYLVRAFEINKDIINCDFHIMVWEQDKEEIAITNLK